MLSRDASRKATPTPNISVSSVAIDTIWALFGLAGRRGTAACYDDSCLRVRQIAGRRRFAQPFEEELVKLAIRVHGPLQTLELRLLAADVLVLLARATECRQDRGLLGLRRLVAILDAFSHAPGLVVEILGGLGQLALGSDHIGMRRPVALLQLGHRLLCSRLGCLGTAHAFVREQGRNTQQVFPSRPAADVTCR